MHGSDADQAKNAPKTLARGRYQLIEPIGEGGIATVWRCTDRILGVERALKLLDEVAGRYPAFRSRFHTEARTMARIEHPTVMRVYDYGAENGRYYLVMELIDGGSVKDLLVQGKRIIPGKALKVAFDVCSALTAVHAMGAVHRDVKPGNLLLARDGTARLSDFGIVRLLDSKPLHETRSDDRLGTVGYMAPEQSEDPSRVGPTADLYAVGATLFAMVTGRHPSVLAALARRPELMSKVHPAIAQVITTATAQSPSDRYPDARTMALAVAQAYDAVEGTSVADGWMLSLDQSLETCLARWGKKASAPTPSPAEMRAMGGPVSMPPQQDTTVQRPPPPPVDKTVLPAPAPQGTPPREGPSAVRPAQGPTPPRSGRRAPGRPHGQGGTSGRATLIAFLLGAALAATAAVLIVMFVLR